MASRSFRSSRAASVASCSSAAALFVWFSGDSRRAAAAARADTGVPDRTERLRATELVAGPPDGVDARGGLRDGDEVGVDAPSRPGTGGFFAAADIVGGDPSSDCVVPRQDPSSFSAVLLEYYAAAFGGDNRVRDSEIVSGGATFSECCSAGRNASSHKKQELRCCFGN